MTTQPTPSQPGRQPNLIGSVLQVVLAFVGGMLALGVFCLGVPWPRQAAPGSLLYIRTVQEALQNLRETGRGKQAGQQAAAFPSPKPEALLQDYYFCPYCRIYHPRWMLSRTAPNRVPSPSRSIQTNSLPPSRKVSRSSPGTNQLRPNTKSPDQSK